MCICERRHEGRHEAKETTKVGQKRKSPTASTKTRSVREKSSKKTRKARRNSSRNWSPPVFERVPKKEFLRNITTKMLYNAIVSRKDGPDEHIDLITKLRDHLVAYGESIYDNDNHPIWNLELTPVKGSAGGVYWGQFDGSNRTKIGSAIDCKIRVDEQPLCASAKVMTLEKIYEALDDKLVAWIADLGLPSLNYHPERKMELKRIISLNVAEGFIGCAYRNDCRVFFEKLVQLPTRSVREAVAMDRMLMCHKYATTGVVPQELQPYSRHLAFFEDIPDGGVHQLYTWNTLKFMNYESGSEFMRAQRPLPKEGFLKDHMAKQRLGKKYGGYTDAVPIAPAAEFIEKNCLWRLLPMIQEGTLDSKSVDAALEPIRKKNWNQYMPASTTDLANGSKPILEAFLKDPTAVAMECQQITLCAIQSTCPGWIEERFDLENSLTFGKSLFVMSKEGKKRLSIHPAHFNIFAPPGEMSIETRFINTEDYLFRVDMMLANGCLSLSQATEIHQRHQTHLMNLTYKQVHYEHSKWDDPQADSMFCHSEPEESSDPCPPRCSVQYANNCANPIGFFKKSQPGIEATAKALGVHQQTFIYLRERLGKENTFQLVSSQGMMWGGKQKEPIPYEVGAQCQGTPAFGSIKAKKCGHPAAAGASENDLLCFVGHQENNLNHPLYGYCACKRCFYKIEQIERHHLRQQAKAKISDDDSVDSTEEDTDEERLMTLEGHLKQRAKNQANYHTRCILTEGADTVYTRDRAKNLKMDDKIVSDPELRAKRNQAWRNREALRQANGGTPKPSGTKRWKYDKFMTARYPNDLRARLKQGVWITMQHVGSQSIYNNKLILILDAIRKEYFSYTEETYYRWEYNRCITAFLKQDGKHWKPKDDRFKVDPLRIKEAFDVKKKMRPKDFWNMVTQKCLSVEEMKSEREFADAAEYGVVQRSFPFDVE